MNVSAQYMFDVLPTVDDSKFDWATETGQVSGGLLVARTLLPIRINNLPVRFLKTTEVPVRVAKAIVVSEAVPMVATGIRMPEDSD